MRKGARQRGVGRLLWLVGLVGLIAVVLAELVVSKADPHWEPGLAIAVFGTFLTSMAIIAAFSIEEKSRWPTPWETLNGARVSAWFLVGLASVVVALLATAVSSRFLDALSLSLAFGGLLLGSLALWGLFSLSSDRGRRELVVDLLSGSIRSSDPPPSRAEADLGEIDTEDHVPAWFLSADVPEPPRRGGVSIELVPSVLRLYADRRDADAIVRLVEEVHAGATRALERDDWGEVGDYLNRVDILLGVQREIFGELARRVLSGRLGEAIASGALAHAGEAAIDVAGRARRLPPSADGRDARRAEVLVVRHLTALCRSAGAAAEEADRALRSGAVAGAAVGGPERARLATLSLTCANLQQAGRWAVDPDPPGMKIPPDHPWRSGLSDAESSLVWLWGAAESPSGPYGVGLYALFETLSGRKFFGSYWDGEDVLTELERRLAAPDIGPTIGAARSAIERAGGLPRLSLELAAARLAATPARARADASDREARRQEDRHVACNLFLAAGGYKPAGRDSHADLAWLLTDRLQGSLWTMVHGQLKQLPEPLVRPSLLPLHRRPDACALAICLRLTPLAPAPGEEEKELLPLREFAGSLSESLLRTTTSLALRLTVAGEVELPSDREPATSALVDAVRFVRRVTPDPIAAAGGAAPAVREPDARPAKPTPSVPVPTGPDEFVESLGRLAAATSSVEVDVIQCDGRWLEEWSDLRSAFDAELLAAALRGCAKIRRIVLLGISGDADRRLTRLHYRWMDALSTAAGCFEAKHGASGPYRVRQLILPFAGPGIEPPRDCVVLRGVGDEPGAGEAARFESVWSRVDRDAQAAASGLGLIELGGRTGTPTMEAPLA